jgi:sigma-B regulation protein RsbU (phosphoserine phosphatase)
MGMAEDLKIVKTLDKLNRVIHRSALASKFVSLFYGELESNGNFIYSNCGHPPPLLYHREKFRELTEGGPVLGPIAPGPGHKYLRGYVQVRPDDVLLLYTDGLTEAASPDGEEFGVERLRSLVVKYARRNSAEIVRKIFKKVQEFTGLTTPADDQTVVVVKRHTS